MSSESQQIESSDKIEKIRPIAALGGIMIAISLVAIIMAICVRLTLAKCCVALEVLVLLTTGIILIVFGAFLLIPAAYGTDYINENCSLGIQGKFEDMDRYSVQIFEPLIGFDE